MTIRDVLLRHIENSNKRGLSVEKLAKSIGIGKRDIGIFKDAVKALEREGEIIITDSNRIFSSKDKSFLRGTIQGNARGFAFLIPDDKTQNDLFVSNSNLNGALNGDEVLAVKIHSEKNGSSDEASVVRVLNRNNKEIIGILTKKKSHYFLQALNEKISELVYISKDNTLGAQDGQVCIVKVINFSGKGKSLQGKVIKVVGSQNDPDVDLDSIIIENKLRDSFPKAAANEASLIRQTVKDEEKEGRIDLTGELIFTIDGYDSKDLDDAVSIKREGEEFELGVHIADVAHYVKDGTALDNEALLRGNSVYLINRVLPMLPVALSNGICSLFPNVERLCLSVIMRIDKNGNVKESFISESVIKSVHQLVYDDVSDYLEGVKAVEELDNIKEQLSLMKELQSILEAKRKKAGAIDFEFPESDIKLNEDGIPYYIGLKERRIANKIIEEFMLVCNETVARKFFENSVPFIYRVHEKPDREKLDEFLIKIRGLGFQFDFSEEISPKDFQKLLKHFKSSKEEKLVSTLMLRSLKKARYSDKRDIHFGLSSEYYTHFTSPIRRYCDLYIHRIIKNYIKHTLSGEKIKKIEKNISAIADHISETERNAERAERQVEDLKKAKYMFERIGEDFVGTVSGITSFGIFVELDNTIEGMVPFKLYNDRFYDFDEFNMTVRDRETGENYGIGTVLNVRNVSVDLSSGTIDFEILNKVK